MKRFGAAPCQWFSPGSKNTRSPGRITSTAPPSRWHRPTPSVTKIVWPWGWVCQAVRAPGVKWTSAAANVDVPAGAATASMYTSPVNQSPGPFWVSMLLWVICMCGFLSLAPPCRRRQGRALPPRVGRVDVGAGRDELVDAVEQRGVDDDVCGGELALEMLHRARTDDRGRHGGMVEHERDGELDQRHAACLGELRELVDDVELGLVARQRKVIARGKPVGAS